MSVQQNKAIVHRLFEEVWNQDKMDVAKEILHDDYSSSENITFVPYVGFKYSRRTSNSTVRCTLTLISRSSGCLSRGIQW